MSKSFDEIMKVIEETGDIPDEKAKTIIEEHGPLTADEKKQIGSAIKMRKQLKQEAEKKKDGDKPDEKKDDEVTMDDYLQALSVLDSEGATAEEKKQAQAVKEKFEG